VSKTITGAVYVEPVSTTTTTTTSPPSSTTTTSPPSSTTTTTTTTTTSPICQELQAAIQQAQQALAYLYSVGPENWPYGSYNWQQEVQEVQGSIAEYQFEMQINGCS